MGKNSTDQYAPLFDAEAATATATASGSSSLPPSYRSISPDTQNRDSLQQHQQPSGQRSGGWKVRRQTTPNAVLKRLCLFPFSDSFSLSFKGCLGFSLVCPAFHSAGLAGNGRICPFQRYFPYSFSLFSLPSRYYSFLLLVLAAHLVWLSCWLDHGVLLFHAQTCSLSNQNFLCCKYCSCPRCSRHVPLVW